MKKLKILLFVIVFTLLNSCCGGEVGNCLEQHISLRLRFTDKYKDVNKSNKDNLKKIINDAIRTEKIKIIFNNNEVDLKLGALYLHNHPPFLFSEYETRSLFEKKNNELELIINNKKITIKYEKFRNHKGCNVFRNLRIISNDGIEYETLPKNIQNMDVWRDYITVYINDVDNLLLSVEKSSL